MSSAMILVDMRDFLYRSFPPVFFGCLRRRFSEIIMLLLCKSNSIFVQIA